MFCLSIQRPWRNDKNLAASEMSTLTVVIFATGRNISSFPYCCEKPRATNRASFNRALTLALHLIYPDYTELERRFGFTPSGNGTSSHVSFFFNCLQTSFIAFSHSGIGMPLASSTELGSSTF
ncbi:hypothetical protein BDE02_13G060500 [Populus trichocarpa]|nr:hypothetical protein BDE02_13G060500 [Populus trichocarpa]